MSSSRVLSKANICRLGIVLASRVPIHHICCEGGIPPRGLGSGVGAISKGDVFGGLWGNPQCGTYITKASLQLSVAVGPFSVWINGHWSALSLE
jgi:hypothetical protein